MTWTFDYRVRYGPLGWLLGQTLIRRLMIVTIDGNLAAMERRVLAGPGA